MALRGFGAITTSAAAQPAFGSTIATAFTVTPDPHTTNPGVGANQTNATVVVANALFWKPGERIGIGTAAQFAFSPSSSTGQPDWGRVATVNYGTNTLTVTGLSRSHAVGEFAVLGTDCATVRIQVSALAYIGGDSSVASNSATLAYTITAAQVTAGLNTYVEGESCDGNVHDTSTYWINQATGTFTPSIVQI